MSRKLATAAVMIVALMLCVAAFASGLANLWLDVPFVQQQRNGCGAASIAMIMQYWEQHQGQPVQSEAQPAQIFHVLYSRPAHGIYASAMARYFQQNGYRAFAFKGRQEDLVSQLQQGRPLIAAVKPGSGPFSGPSLHYVVVVGLDQSRKLVLVNDPAQRKLLKEDQAQFEREWKATGNWILLAVPEASSPDASKN
jgi:ABC-type bacteriocin/lantibiotic exporter with double-glycine peptidase domain